jgi:hypothetical protein
MFAQPIADHLLQHGRRRRLVKTVNPADGIDIEVFTPSGRMMVPSALEPWAYSDSFLSRGFSDALSQSATVS